MRELRQTHSASGTIATAQTAEDDLPTALGRRMRAARRARGMTQTELGDACGSSQAVIQKIENGHSTRPRIDAEIAEALDVPLEWLLCGTIGMDLEHPEHDPPLEYHVHLATHHGYRKRVR